MGKRDFEKRETKKPKKGSKKAPSIAEFAPPPIVEVVRRKRKDEEEVED
jgi:hypothetical protein